MNKDPEQDGTIASADNIVSLGDSPLTQRHDDIMNAASGTILPEMLDFDTLLRLSREKSLESRSALADQVSDLFSERNQLFTEQEKSLVFQILHQLVADIEAGLRKKISTMLAAEPALPRDFVRFLANDQIDIAWPVLRKSPALQDSDLIEIIEKRGREHWLAIAGREVSMGASVGDALVGTGDPSVLQELVHNENAALSDLAMQHIVAQSEQYDALQAPLLDRKELTPDLARRMVHWVAASMREQMGVKFGFDLSSVDDLMERAAAEYATEQDVPSQSKSATEQLVESLDRLGEISPAMMIRALEDGDTSLFFSLFRSKTGLSVMTVKRLAFAADGFGLCIACRALGFEERQFSILFLMMARARKRNRDSAVAELEQSTVMFRRIEKSTAQKLLHEWARNGDYRAALLAIDATQTAAAV